MTFALPAEGQKFPYGPERAISVDIPVIEEASSWAVSDSATHFCVTYRRERAIAYDLVFWKETGDPGVSPSVVYRSLIDGHSVVELETLPIETILSELIAALPGSVRESNTSGLEWIDWDSDDGLSSIQISWSNVHVYADCRSVSYEIVNRIIEVLAGFGCPLYDPQEDERFDRRRTE